MHGRRGLGLTCADSLASRCRVDADYVLGLQAFSDRIDPTTTLDAQAGTNGHDHDHDEHEHQHGADDNAHHVSTAMVVLNEPLRLKAVEAWLQTLLWDEVRLALTMGRPAVTSAHRRTPNPIQTSTIMRAKGEIAVAGEPRRYVLQGGFAFHRARPRCLHTPVARWAFASQSSSARPRSSLMLAPLHSGVRRL